MAKMTEAEISSYKEKISAMSEDELVEEMCDTFKAAGHTALYDIDDQKAGLCFDECERNRGGQALYNRAWAKAEAQVAQ